MDSFEFTLPAMGEGIIEATITRWFVNEGDAIKEDDPLVEVATDKVDSEIPSPVSGIVSRIIYHEGEIPKVGEVLATISLSGEVKPSAKITDTNPEINTQKKTDKPAGVLKPFTGGDNGFDSKVLHVEQPVSHDLIITPLIRFLARSREITFGELKQIKGSGLDGRITRDDLISYIQKGRPYMNTGQTYPEMPVDVYKPAPGEEVVEMDRTRKVIAENMVRSKRISPHVTSMVEIDITSLVQWRENNKDHFTEKYGIKLTYTPVIVDASARALKEYPDINISVVGSRIIKKHYINIGVATALPDGNLIVPVIREADKLDLPGIAIKLADLTGRARSYRLHPSEVKGGTFTITNMGQYDNVSGTPIINQPEVAILAVGAIKKKPGIVNTPEGPAVGIRDIIVLSLTYDHRVIDGSLGGSFVRAIGRYLENNPSSF